MNIHSAHSTNYIAHESRNHAQFLFSEPLIVFACLYESELQIRYVKGFRMQFFEWAEWVSIGVEFDEYQKKNLDMKKCAIFHGIHLGKYTCTIHFIRKILGRLKIPKSKIWYS